MDGGARIFSLPIGESHLSHGQRILLKLAVALHSQSGSLRGSILFFDEPEKHLHPAMAIEIIDRLRNELGEGQIWIATHSISVLAHVEPEEIWYLENHRVSYSGRSPQRVLDELLGDEGRRARLQDFLNLPAELGANRHAFECLIEAAAVMTGQGDPQTHQIRSGIERLGDGEKVRILDFGAGKGRLAASIAESGGPLRELVDYVAFDPFERDQDECLGNIASLYSDSSRRYFNDIDQLLNVYQRSSFDVVVFCNVLHEIDPTKWTTIFGTGKLLHSLLKEAGTLMVVEDLLMPVGETAYQKGYMVLDTGDLMELFDIGENESGFAVDDARDGRLKCHMIERSLLLRMTNDSRIACIKAINERALRKIQETRSLDVTYLNGKILGFWLQQFVTSRLALDELDASTQ